MLYAIHLETLWWVETNVFEYSNYRRFHYPELDMKSLTSPLAWKLYWIELKQRVLPPLMKYQATLLFMHFFQEILKTLVSKETLLRLNQHPPHRALAISERESDRLLVGMEVFVASIWANTLFFAASYMVGQVGALYNYYRRRMIAVSRGSEFCDRDDVALLANTSWGLFYLNVRRHLYSSIGAGTGSIRWPGLGTWLCTGIGDEWARKQPTAELPQYVMALIRGGIGDISRVFSRMRWFARNDDGVNDPQKNESDQDDLMCGCCQTTLFSSNPSSRDRAPISSRACDHTICKSCVQQCHLAFMERTSNYEEWIKCPLCNTSRAFNCQDHLVNRSLCAAIAAIERSQIEPAKKLQ